MSTNDQGQMAYFVEDSLRFRVYICEPPRNVPRDPTAEERAALDAFFGSPAAKDPDDGELVQWLGHDVPGITSGAIMMYPEGPST
jgi:hypothetical protein